MSQNGESHRSSHGMSHGISHTVYGTSHGMTYGTFHGMLCGTSHGMSYGAFHGSSHGMSYGTYHGTSRGMAHRHYFPGMPYGRCFAVLKTERGGADELSSVSMMLYYCDHTATKRQYTSQIMVESHRTPQTRTSGAITRMHYRY